MSVQRTFTGTCPEHNEEATVTAEYAEIRTIGNPMTGYKYMGHSCSVGSFKGCSQENCPLIDQG